MEPAAAGGGGWSQSPPSAAQRARGVAGGGVAKKRGGRKSGGKRRRAGSQRQASHADAADGTLLPALDGSGPPAPGSAQRHRRGGRAPRARTPLARPTAPKNSSSFLMRCATLGLQAPLFSPPQSTPHEGLGGGPSSALRWVAEPPDVLDAGAGPLASLLPGPALLDPWGSNLDKIRRVDAPGVALPAASAAGDDAAGDDGAGDALVAPLAGDGGGVLGFRFEERGPQYLAQLESENAALRARLQVAEGELQRLRGAGEAEASVVAPHHRAATEATSAEQP